MDTGFLIGAIITVVSSIVLGVAANLLTRYPEAYLANYSKNRTRRLVTKRLAFIKQLEHYKDVPADYHTFMLNMILQIVVQWSGFFLLGSVATLTLWFALSTPMHSLVLSFLFGMWLWLAYTVISTFIKLIRSLATSFQVYANVDKIKTYKQGLQWTIDKAMRKHPEWLEGIIIPDDVWQDHKAIMRKAEDTIRQLQDVDLVALRDAKERLKSITDSISDKESGVQAQEKT